MDIRLYLIAFKLLLVLSMMHWVDDNKSTEFKVLLPFLFYLTVNSKNSVKYWWKISTRKKVIIEKGEICNFQFFRNVKLFVKHFFNKYHKSNFHGLNIWLVPANMSRLSFGPCNFFFFEIRPRKIFCLLKKSLDPLMLQGGTQMLTWRMLTIHNCTRGIKIDLKM